MPLDKNQIERLQIIHFGLLNQEFKTEELIDYIYQEQLKKNADTKPITKRTLIKDIQYLRKQGAPIPFRSKVYKYTQAYSFMEALGNSDTVLLEELKGIVSKLNQMNKISDLINVDLERMSFKLKDLNDEIIFFEETPDLTNKNLLPILYDFIIARKVIQFTYTDFHGKKFEPILHPYLLKEYNGRWYIYGFNEEERKIYHYPIDRMSDRIQEKKYIPFKEKGNWNPKKHFQDLLGVTRLENMEAEEITFKAFGLTQYYLMNKPLHNSQNILDEEDEYTLFSLYVVINFELKSKLYALSDHIEIISPESLRNEFKETYHRLSLRYS